MHGHDHLDELDLIRLGELLVVEKGRKLGFRTDKVGLASLAFNAAHNFKKFCPFPKY